MCYLFVGELGKMGLAWVLLCRVSVWDAMGQNRNVFWKGSSIHPTVRMISGEDGGKL
jgi:hypothetical protein